MEPRQRAALQMCMYDLIRILDPEAQYFLFANGVFRQTDLDEIGAEITQDAKRFKLLSLLVTKNNSWNQLLDVLAGQFQTHLVDTLKTALASQESELRLTRNINQTLEP